MSPAATAASKASAKKADLKLSTSARPGSRMAIEIVVPADRTQGSHNDAVEKLSRSVRLPGFRQGKVPRAVLMQQIGPMRIRATAHRDAGRQRLPRCPQASGDPRHRPTGTGRWF